MWKVSVGCCKYKQGERIIQCPLSYNGWFGQRLDAMPPEAVVIQCLPFIDQSSIHSFTWEKIAAARQGYAQEIGTSSNYIEDVN